MDYIDLYQHLKRTINFDDDATYVDDKVVVHTQKFESDEYKILLGATHYHCSKHQLDFSAAETHAKDQLFESTRLDAHDSQIEENQNFNYKIFMPKDTAKAQGIIFLFHGFNEKHWHKYLPWAHKMVCDTQKAVILFPIAFHMNRAPQEWSNMKLMFKVSEYRKNEYPDILCSTISNVAISSRLTSHPSRFLWAGLQTYHDVHKLITQIKSGEHSLIDPRANIDFFSYSIGGFLSQILVMANKGGIFNHSKLFIFCGGAVFNRITPVTRFILDSEANVALYSYLVEHIESHLSKDKRLDHHMGTMHPEGFYFRSMLDYRVHRKEREKRLEDLSKNIKSAVLEKDTVMPPYEIENTLQGSSRKIPIEVRTFDYSFPYKHEDPFPQLEKHRNEINDAFEKTIGFACDFLK